MLVYRPAREPAVHRFLSDYVDALQRWFLLGSESQEQGWRVLKELDCDISRFPPELRERFADEYESLQKLVRHEEERKSRLGRQAA